MRDVQGCGCGCEVTGGEVGRIWLGGVGHGYFATRFGDHLVPGSACS